MEQFLKDYGYIISVIIIPIGIWIGSIWYQNRQLKIKTKKELFLTLFAFRGMPSSYEFVNALNKVQIVFNDNEDIIESWKNLFSEFKSAGEQKREVNQKLSDNYKTEMFSHMAKVLGYSNLRNDEILQPYYPEVHSINDWMNHATRQELFRYLQKNADLAEILIQVQNALEQQDK